MDGLREFLSRTAGEHLLNLWLDITLVRLTLISTFNSSLSRIVQNINKNDWHTANIFV